MDFSMLDYLLIGMGLYVLWGGISGKGRLYAADNVKEGMEQKYHDVMQKFFIGFGILMTLNGASSLLRTALFEKKLVTEATETAKAVYEWFPKKDLGAFSFLTGDLLEIVTWVLMGVCLAGVVYMAIVVRKLTDKYPHPKQAADAADQTDQQRRAARQEGHSLPVSAFEFDDEPAAIDAQQPDRK